MDIFFALLGRQNVTPIISIGLWREKRACQKCSHQQIQRSPPFYLERF